VKSKNLIYLQILRGCKKDYVKPFFNLDEKLDIFWMKEVIE